MERRVETDDGAPRRRRSQRGSAVTDFALVSVVLVPLFFAVLQLALIWHVQSTLTSAASEGARYGAAYDRTPGDGQQRTESVIADTFGEGFGGQVTARQGDISGQEIVELDVQAQVPTLGLWGPTVTVSVQGHAIKEYLP